MVSYEDVSLNYYTDSNMDKRVLSNPENEDEKNKVTES